MTPDDRASGGNEYGELRDLAKQAQWESLHAYEDLLIRVAPQGWPRRLADLNVRYYEQLLKGGQSLSDQWVEAVERVMPDRPDARADGHRTERHHTNGRANGADGPRRVPMSLHAASGETARGSISLENKERTETEVSFLVSDFTSSDGDSIRPALAVEPERFRLGPLEERVVVLQVPLEPDLFPPGKIFRGAVAVRGYDDLELALTIWCDE